MVVRWQIIFKTLTQRGVSKRLTLQVYDASATKADEVINLLGAPEPISTGENSDDDYYSPIRTQSGYIRFVCQDTRVLGDIMPSNSTDRPVILRSEDGNILWAGFLSGEQFSQPWQPTPYVIDLPVKGIMETMKGVDFIQDDGITSLSSLISLISSHLPYSIGVVYPKVAPIDKVFVVNDNFREYLTVKEREQQATTNAYSTSSIYDCVEAFCKYFGLACHEWHGNLYFIQHDCKEYIDNSGSIVMSSVHDLANLQIRSASNKAGFAKFYRYVHGEFDTGANGDNSQPVMELDNFSDIFEVDKSENNFVFFKPNTQVRLIVPNTAEYYSQRIGDSFPLSTYCCPQMQCGIIYRRATSEKDVLYIDSEGSHSIWGKDGSSVEDDLQVTTYLIDNKPEPIFRLVAERKICILKDDASLLNISCKLDGMGERIAYAKSHPPTTYAMKANVSNGGIYLSIKIGDYYLKITEKNTIKTSEWTKDAVYIEADIDDNGDIVGNFFNSQKDKYTFLSAQNSGMYISLPDFLRNTPQQVEITLYSGIIHPFSYKGGSSSTSGFGGNATGTHPGMLTDDGGSDLKCTYLHLAYSNIRMALVYPSGGYDNIGLDMSQNRYTIPNGNASPYDYGVSSVITTRQGAQHGTGLALNQDYTYVTVQYDKEGCQRRAELFKDNHATLAVCIGNITQVQPIDTISWHGKTFAILAQAQEWKSGDNDLQLLKLD